jgi:hypothetical protein
LSKQKMKQSSADHIAGEEVTVATCAGVSATSVGGGTEQYRIVANHSGHMISSDFSVTGSIFEWSWCGVAGSGKLRERLVDAGVAK